MSHKEVLKMMEEKGLCFAYDYFVKREASELPLTMFRYLRADNFSVGGIAYFKINELDIELYMDLKNLKLKETV